MSDSLRDRLVAAVGALYDVEAEIGRGGMAVVYKARDVRLRRVVAIKLLPPELAYQPDIRSRFLREAETAAQLSHPNIVPIYSVDERDGLVFFVMAFVTGKSLGELLVRDIRPPIDQARTILAEVADALACAHRAGVVHRDIKPDNILLDAETGRAMVTDFGIARAAEGGARLTATGVAVGTPAYMSPEQAMGEREVDGRSDIYSLGVVGYQMLAGEPPFAATNTPSMLMKHMSEQPRPLAGRRPDVPPSLVRAIERALAKSPADRWADAARFRDALLDKPGAAELPPSRHAPQEYTAPLGLPVPFAPRFTPPFAPPFGVPAEAMEKIGNKLMGRRERKALRAKERDAAPIQEQISAFHRHLIGSGSGIVTCWAINLTTSEFLWAIFPTIGMGVGLLGHAGRLWAKGVSVQRLFSRPSLSEVGAGAVPALSGGRSSSGATQESIADAAARLVPDDVLRGKHGVSVRRAVADRDAVLETVSRLPIPDRQLIPDVAPTVAGLVDRVASIAQALHRLDGDVAPEMLARLDARIIAAREVAARPVAASDAGATSQTQSHRTLALLERQRVTIDDLLQRRDSLEAQLDSACLLLQNIRLDLLKLRSAGIGSGSLDDVTNATQEARALSREIGHVLDAAAQVRAL